MAQPIVTQAILQSITVLLPYLRHYCSQSQYYYRTSGTTAVNHSTATVPQALLQSITVLLPYLGHYCSQSQYCYRTSGTTAVNHSTATVSQAILQSITVLLPYLRHYCSHNPFHAFLYWQVTYIFFLYSFSFFFFRTLLTLQLATAMLHNIFTSPIPHLVPCHRGTSAFTSRRKLGS
jgi:hypothetical protein